MSAPSQLVAKACSDQRRSNFPQQVIRQRAVRVWHRVQLNKILG
jgi:hypothetical protein